MTTEVELSTEEYVASSNIVEPDHTPDRKSSIVINNMELVTALVDKICERNDPFTIACNIYESINLIETELNHTTHGIRFAADLLDWTVTRRTNFSRENLTEEYKSILTKLKALLEEKKEEIKVIWKIDPFSIIDDELSFFDPNWENYPKEKACYTIPSSIKFDRLNGNLCPELSIFNRRLLLLWLTRRVKVQKILSMSMPMNKRVVAWLWGFPVIEHSPNDLTIEEAIEIAKFLWLDEVFH